MLLDVSQPVSEKTAHFPGDQPFSCGWTSRLERNDPVNLSWVKSSPHVGTHVDAPYHFEEQGRRVGALDPHVFVGRAVVVDATGCDALTADIVRGLDLSETSRVLFKTQAKSDPESFLEKFPCLTTDAVDLLAEAGVRLVGVDVPSMDAADAKELIIHQALGRAGIVNIENLMLDDAETGTYELLAAPVRWDGLDGAPVRALLRR